MSPLAKAYIQLKLRGEPGDVALRALLLAWNLDTESFMAAWKQWRSRHTGNWTWSGIAKELLRQEGIDV